MSVWTGPEDDVLPLVPPEWRDAMRRWFAQAMLAMRLPLALTGGLLAALGVLLVLAPAPPPPPTGGDVGAGAWTRQVDPPRIATRAAAMAETGTWSRETIDGRETEDRHATGSLDGGSYALVIAARRPAAASRPGFFVASVRAAANAGLAVGRFGGIRDHAGRFGPTETAVVSMTNPSQRAARADCLAWRAGGDGEIVLSGFLCLAGGAVADSGTLECALRDLAPAPGSDAALRQVLKPATTLAACKTPIADAAGQPGSVRGVAGTRHQGKL